MPTVILNRANGYQNRFHTYKVYIDGTKVGEISNGESKSFDIDAGKHKIVCKIDWCSSATIPMDISNGEVKTFKVGGFKYSHLILAISLASLGLLPLFRNAIDFEYLYYLIIPLGVVVIYYLTIGRRKYLSLKEV